jgi:hypothetical protein
VLDKSKMDRNIREALITNDSITNRLNLRFGERTRSPTLKIKLEIDIKPPAGSTFAYTYLDFPLDFEVCHQDLPSNFALKIHALLCRPYLKGRDWYHFNWYVKQKVHPDLPHLQAALKQIGPWKGHDLDINTQWVISRLREKIATTDWKAAAANVERFLGSAERASLSLWSSKFFDSRDAKLFERALRGPRGNRPPERVLCLPDVACPRSGHEAPAETFVAAAASLLSLPWTTTNRSICRDRASHTQRSKTRSAS